MSIFSETFSQVVNTYEIRNKPEMQFYSGQSVIFSGFLSSSNKEIISDAPRENYHLKILVVYSSPQLHKIELRVSRASLNTENYLLTLEDIRDTFDQVDSVDRIVSMLNEYTTRQ